MKFTPNEWEIISHRLGVPCAIAEALVGCFEEDPEEYERVYEKDEIQNRAWELEANKGKPLDMNSELDRLILEDCCGGSTFFSDSDDALARGEITQGKLNAYKRAANSLSKKVGVQVTMW
jgi:hypothetical protein